MANPSSPSKEDILAEIQLAAKLCRDANTRINGLCAAISAMPDMTDATIYGALSEVQELLRGDALKSTLSGMFMAGTSKTRSMAAEYRRAHALGAARAYQ